MELTPIDVQQKTFRASLRGYDEQEVDEFLDQVVETLHAYQQRFQETEERVAALEEELAATRETEEAIKRTFVAAQRTRDEMIEEARDEAARIIAEAKDEADELVAEARLRTVRMEEDHRQEREELIEEVELLRDVVGDLRERLQRAAAGALDELVAFGERLDEAELAVFDEPQRAEEVTVGEISPEEPEEEEPDRGEESRAGGEAEDEISEEEPEPLGAGQATYLRRPRARRPWERDEG